MSAESFVKTNESSSLQSHATSRPKNQEERVVVVKFGAKWCGPCKRSEPEYEMVRKDYSGNPIDFYSVDIEDPPPKLPEKISDLISTVTSIPLIVIFPPGGGEPTKIKSWKEADVRLAIESVLPKPSPRKNEFFIRPGTVLSSSEEDALDEFLDVMSDEDDAEEFDVNQ